MLLSFKSIFSDYFKFLFCGYYNFLISVGVFVGGLMLDGGWMICCVLLGKSETDRFIGTGSFKGDRFGFIALALVGE